MDRKDQCYEVRELLSLYIDSELKEAEREMVESHLEICEACRMEYEELLEVVGLLAGISNAAVPDGFDLRLKRGLEEEGKRIRQMSVPAKFWSGSKKKWRVAGSIAAVFAVGMISYFAADNMQILHHELQKSGEDQVLSSSQPADANEQTAAPKAIPGDENRSSKDEIVGTDSSAAELKNAAAKNYNMQKKTNTESGVPAVPKPVEINTVKGDTNPKQKAEAPMQQSPQSETQAGGGVPAAANSSADEAVNGIVEGSPEKMQRSVSIPEADKQTAHINNAQEKNYRSLIEERFSGCDFEIKDAICKNNGEWYFTVFLSGCKDGNIIGKEIEVVGKDDKIEILHADEDMGF